MKKNNEIEKKNQGFWSWWWKRSKSLLWFVCVLIGVIALIVGGTVGLIQYGTFVYNTFIHFGEFPMVIIGATPIFAIVILCLLYCSYLEYKKYKEEEKTKKLGMDGRN